MHFIFNKRNLLLIGIAGSLLLNSAMAQEQPTVQTEVLLRSSSSWDGTPYKAYPKNPPELTVTKITIPPHTTLSWHTHPMPNAGYMLSGELTVEKKENGQKKVLVAGEVLPEMVDELHRGFTGDKPAVLIVFYAGTKDMPLSQH